MEVSESAIQSCFSDAKHYAHQCKTLAFLNAEKPQGRAYIVASLKPLAPHRYALHGLAPVYLYTLSRVCTFTRDDS